MSRRRWIVLLGPPLLIAVAAVSALSLRALRAGAAPPLPPRSVGTCPSLAPNLPASGRSSVPGTWWRTDPLLDGSGTLEGWTLRVGGPEAADTELRLPAGSTVTGPIAGRVVVASEAGPGEAGSVVRIVDAIRGCATEIGLADRIARRAVADPAGDGVLAHLLEPESRRDLGVWRIEVDGQIAERLVEPLPDAILAAAGIDRVWTTDLRLDAAGGRLAVQSCQPVACVTRIVDLGSGDLAVLAGEGQGPIVGFAGDRLVTWAACEGLPCPVVAWSLPDGSATTLSGEAGGAALTADGRQLVVVQSDAGNDRPLAAIDVLSGAIRPIGARGAEALPLSGGAGMVAGLETAGAAVAIGHAGRVPVAVSVENDAEVISPDREVQP